MPCWRRISVLTPDELDKLEDIKRTLLASGEDPLVAELLLHDHLHEMVEAHEPSEPEPEQYASGLEQLLGLTVPSQVSPLETRLAIEAAKPRFNPYDQVDEAVRVENQEEHRRAE